MSDEFKHVDTDWKARAAADREKLARKLAEEKRGEPQLPPASFTTIVSTFVTQAMIALGEVELPGAKGRTVDLQAARFAIDSLGILKEKTAGNLGPGEQQELDAILQSLRLRYVHKSKEAEANAGGPRPS
jgi:hypothetical protein